MKGTASEHFVQMSGQDQGIIWFIPLTMSWIRNVAGAFVAHQLTAMFGRTVINVAFNCAVFKESKEK